MSADISAPEQFTQWLERRGIHPEGFAAQFIPRSLYAEYLDATLKESLPKAPNLDVQFIRAEVQSLVHGESGWTVVHKSGSVFANLVVLGTGNDMPAPLKPQYTEVASRIVDIPWGHLALAQDEDVLILGTGLTAMDTVVTLMGLGHRGNIYLLSRRGLCPARHVPPLAGEALRRPFPTTVRALARAMRQAAGCNPSPEKWQGFIDSMRPFWSEIWQNFSVNEKHRFLRHGIAHWSAHRHRLAPNMADQVEIALRSNAKIIKGRLTGLAQGTPSQLAATITFRGKQHSLHVNRVINCTGPNSDPAKSYYPLIQNIIGSGYARSGPAMLGLDVDEKHRVLGADGVVHPNLFAMGALTRGRWWEITAIPELLHQATEIANQLYATALR